MNPVQIAKIQADAANKERLEIACQMGQFSNFDIVIHFMGE